MSSPSVLPLLFTAQGAQREHHAHAEIGIYGYYLANASENTISGGFISGGPANMTVIRSVGEQRSLRVCRCPQFIHLGDSEKNLRLPMAFGADPPATLVVRRQYVQQLFIRQCGARSGFQVFQLHRPAWAFHVEHCNRA